MRSAALFEADNERRKAGRTGRRPDTRRVSQRQETVPSSEDVIGEDDPRTPATDDGKKGGKASWFLHDDRDREELETRSVQRRAVGPGDDRSARGRRTESQRPERVPQNRGLPDASLDAPASKWEYVDPKGNIQGPFPASDLVKWANGGFFSSDQQVRRAGQHAFVPLMSVLAQLQREAKGAAAAPARPSRRPDAAAQVNGRAVRQEAPARRAIVDARTREPRSDRSAGGAGYQHPADALLSPEETAARGNNAHAAPSRGDGYSYSPRDARDARGGRFANELGGRGGRRDSGSTPGNQGLRGRGRGGGRGGGYGRGGRGQGAAPVQAAAVAVGNITEPRLPFSAKIAQKLFTAEAELATDEPVWRYIDPSGTVQGPFPAKNMLEWYRKGMLHDMGLKVCGAERKVAPPDMPLPIHYYKLGDLLDSVKRGQRYSAVSVADIRSGISTFSLQAKAPEVVVKPAPGTRRTDAPKAGKRKVGTTPSPTKDALEAVKVKVSILESGEGCSVQLTVGRPAGQPLEASMVKPDGEDAAVAAAPAAEQSSKPAADAQESQAAAPKAPTEVTLPEALLPEIEGATGESPAGEAAEAGTGAPLAAAPEKSAVPDAASGAAADVPAPTAASPPAAEDETKKAGKEEPAAHKADAAGEAPQAEEIGGASADADAEVEAAETAKHQAADDTAVPQQVEVSKETAPVEVAEPVEESDADPASHKSAVQEESKVGEVVAVLSSNVSAVVEAETNAPASIEEQPQAEEVQNGKDTAVEAGEAGGSSSLAKKPAAPAAEDVFDAEETGAKVPKHDVHTGSNAAGGAKDAAEDKEVDVAADAAPTIRDAPSEAAEEEQSKEVVAADAPPVVEEAEMDVSSKEDGAAGNTQHAKEADGKAADVGQGKEEAAVLAEPKEGAAKEEAAQAEEEKPKQQTSMFKSALKMFQGK
ncbi:probable GRB10-interacting GYF protein 1 at N-terminal half [Coccomyxa sp. Obi]|nr:probable GRB10-interacting GYF protein 1 at N-terminal half [Coccomyxa sp. Obi]